MSRFVGVVVVEVIRWRRRTVSGSRNSLDWTAACPEIRNRAPSIPAGQEWSRVKLAKRNGCGILIMGSWFDCYLAWSEREDSIHVFDELSERGPLHRIVLPTFPHQKVPKPIETVIKVQLVEKIWFISWWLESGADLGFALALDTTNLVPTSWSSAVKRFKCRQRQDRPQNQLFLFLLLFPCF